MNRRRSIATTTHQPRHDRYQLQETETPLAPDLRALYLIDSCIKEHGTNGVAVAKMIADQFQQTINDWQISNLHFTPVPVTKPSPGERTIIIKLSDDDDDIKLRVWGDPFNDAHFFCFDFINGFIQMPMDLADPWKFVRWSGHGPARRYPGLGRVMTQIRKPMALQRVPRSASYVQTTPTAISPFRRGSHEMLYEQGDIEGENVSPALALLALPQEPPHASSFLCGRSLA
ncbi:hypothetical protein BD779DRAFT_1785789 [Infundibulicybe gibba]|nr:hypothetical protein BD779DRAFT_1785789 [Infundibulicybe gibba]